MRNERRRGEDAGTERAGAARALRRTRTRPAGGGTATLVRNGSGSRGRCSADLGAADDYDGRRLADRWHNCLRREQCKQRGEYVFHCRSRHALSISQNFAEEEGRQAESLLGRWPLNCGAGVFACSAEMARLQGRLNASATGCALSAEFTHLRARADAANQAMTPPAMRMPPSSSALMEPTGSARVRMAVSTIRAAGGNPTAMAPARPPGTR